MKSIRIPSVFAAALLLSIAPAQALIIHGEPTSTSNPAAHYAPPSHVGWNYVGSMAEGTGIYLGHGWVLTASHVKIGNINLNGVTFEQDTNTASVRLQNPNETNTDLLLFKILGDPGLSPLDVSSTPAAAGANVFMMGTGLDRGSALKQYTSPPNPIRGYDWSAARAKVWGSNDISGTGLIVNAGFGDVHSFSTTFNEVVGQGQAAAQDSGGAIFDANSNTLLGMMHAINRFSSQPVNTAAFGNQTFHADLSVYRDQIVAVVPEPGSALLLLFGGAMLLLRRRR